MDVKSGEEQSQGVSFMARVGGGAFRVRFTNL